MTEIFKCVWCGRILGKPVAHRCNGNFRKRHLKWVDNKEE